MRNNLHKAKTLIITAHPDDEALWFTSIAMRHNCDLVCVTCGSNRKEAVQRKDELLNSCALLGIVNVHLLHYRDAAGSRLKLRNLARDLSPLARLGYRAVYTHGPFGETNEHAHHQDICLVANMVFPSVKCVSWNLYPEEINILTAGEYQMKKFIMGTIYAREYRRLKTTYELSSVEKFVTLGRDSIELFYWSIANFGDHHEKLGKRFDNIWGYDLSPYEIERHRCIARLAASVRPKSILEIGACEGVLTGKLYAITRNITCLEKASVYRKKLVQTGHRVLRTSDSGAYDLTVVASVLEYMDNPTSYVQRLRSRFVIIDVIQSRRYEEVALSMKKSYKLICVESIAPRWEAMYIADHKERMEVYKLGANVFLFERK